MVSTVSLIVRCFNEEAHIGRLLTGAQRQTRPPDEVVVVDSGSTDATLAIASAFGAKIVHVRPGTFSFGGALNRGIEAATGDVCVFASAHVYPVYDSWLEHLVAPLEEDDAIALSYGRQVIPAHGQFSEGRLLEQWFPQTSNPRQRDPFCNNANAAIRREVWRDLPYDEDLTGLEDLHWAKRALDRGYALAYRADAPIVHVHEEVFSQIVNRYRREAIAHKAIYDDQEMSAAQAVRLAVQNVVLDALAARRQGCLWAEARGIVRFRLAQFYGAYRGFRQHGPVSQLLRWRFYYPPKSAGGPSQEDQSAVGNIINYDELPAEDRR
ncbi:glycosyltransferase family 2 protein [Baekduia sp. Peel2402]|uniref:glycosyltransferase family 2 protein n=1 Tax=Baekduia sp. Peel2402 TaxID=3458296 RepID=UPI00403E6CDB